MIFVTVGTQLPFPRLITELKKTKIINKTKIVAQTASPNEVIEGIESYGFLAPNIYIEHFKAADFIISHAGIGSILTAKKYNKPILIMPRRANLNEHRNNHQVATARALENRKGIYRIETYKDIDNIMSRQKLEEPEDSNIPELNQLKSFLQKEVDRTNS